MFGGACDAFTQKDESGAGPYIHVVGANVGITQALPQDGVIQIAFDRFLNPLWVNRQSIALRDEFGGAPDSPIVQYDPVTRVVTLSSPDPGKPWLAVNQFYEILFPIPQEAGAFGLRAIDGATMDPSTPRLGFMVTAPTGAPFALPKIDFCADVFPLLRVKYTSTKGFSIEGACGSAACHGGSPEAAGNTAMGLVLDTEDGIRRTAIGVVAHETNTTALAGQPLPAQNVFPAGMPIIDPGNPGDSYLLYKLLVAPSIDQAPQAVPYDTSTNAGCKTKTPPFDYGPGSVAPGDEAVRLSNRIMGERMPRLDAPLTLDEIERIRLWIAQGAVVDDCGQCPATGN